MRNKVPNGLLDDLQPKRKRAAKPRAGIPVEAKARFERLAKALAPSEDDLDLAWIALTG